MNFAKIATGTAIAVVVTLSAYAAYAVGGTYSLAPNENREIYVFGNLHGFVTIESSQPLNLRWVHTGEKKEVMLTNGRVTLELPALKADGHLEASNQGNGVAEVRVTENTKVNDLAQTWQAFWGTAAGGPNSTVNTVHRNIKKWLNKPFG